MDDPQRLTTEQAAILGAYTGVLLGNFEDMHAYIEKVLERSVLTHELGNKVLAEQIRDAARADVLAMAPESTRTHSQVQS